MIIVLIATTATFFGTNLLHSGNFIRRLYPWLYPKLCHAFNLFKQSGVVRVSSKTESSYSVFRKISYI